MRLHDDNDYVTLTQVDNEYYQLNGAHTVVYYDNNTDLKLNHIDPPYITNNFFTKEQWNELYIYLGLDNKVDNYVGGTLDDNDFVPAQYIDCAVISPLTFEIWPNILTLVDVSHGGHFVQDTYPTITNI